METTGQLVADRQFGLIIDRGSDDIVDSSLLITAMAIATRKIPPMLGHFHVRENRTALALGVPLLVDDSQDGKLTITRLESSER